jgi:cobalt-zinc-cadmium efflux system outer membrane protein
MNKIKRSAFLLLILGVTCRVASESVPLYLDDVIAEAVRNNPEIMAVRSQYEAAHARTSALRQMPDPQIGVEFADNSRMYSITQQIPFPGKLAAGSAVARTGAEEYVSLIAEKEQDIINRAKKAYVLLSMNHQNIRALERSVTYLAQIYRVVSRQYAVGASAQAHVLRVQVELARAEEYLRVQKDAVTIAEAQLNILLDRPVDAGLGIPVSLDVQVSSLEYDSLIELARRAQPHLQAVRQEMILAEQMISAARQHYFPDMMVKMTRMDSDMDAGGQKFMFGITLPVWFFGKQNEMIREAQARLKGAAARYRAQENAERLRIYEAQVSVQSKDRTVRLLEDAILPQAEANLRAALAAYETNQINFQNLLDSEKILIQSELEYYRAQAELLSAVADLEKAVGSDLFVLTNKE